jgi:hypothetical protein
MDVVMIKKPGAKTGAGLFSVPPIASLGPLLHPALSGNIGCTKIGDPLTCHHAIAQVYDFGISATAIASGGTIKEE